MTINLVQFDLCADVQGGLEQMCANYCEKTVHHRLREDLHHFCEAEVTNEGKDDAHQSSTDND